MEFLSNQEIERILSGLVRDVLIPKFISLGMNASGEWIRSIEVRGNEIWGRDYTRYLTDGRGANKDQDPEKLHKWVGYYGSTIFAKWVKDKGLSINPYAVAYKVARSGNRYFPEGTDLLKVLRSEQTTRYLEDKLREVMIPNYEDFLVEIVQPLKN